MHTPCTHTPQQQVNNGAHQKAHMAVLLGLPGWSGCTGSELDARTWPVLLGIVLLVALPLCAWLAYALGSLRTRQQSGAQLRAARAALGLAE